MSVWGSCLHAPSDNMCFLSPEMIMSARPAIAVPRTVPRE